MNGEYLVTPGQIYYTQRKGGDRFKIDNQNKINYKAGSKIESFENLVYRVDYEKQLKDAFAELGELEEEKGNLMIFKNTNGDNIYIYNSKEQIKHFDHHIYYANLLFEDRQDQIVHKTEDLCAFVLDSNIDQISKLAKLLSIKDKSQFIQNISNDAFIEKELGNVDNKTMEDIFLLGKGCHIGYYGKLYLYAFLEKGGKLIPIYFNDDNMANFDIAMDKAYDKVEVIIKMEGYEKISLFGGKLFDNIMFFNSDVLLETELQAFYNELIGLNNTHTNKEMENNIENI